MSDKIEKLYEYYGVLVEAKDKIGDHENEYKEILSAVKGSDKEKRLASQFIAKFFNSFPKHSEQALEAVFDLCEDDDVAIRKQAIKDLPSLCKQAKEHTQRIADILAQLLQTEDQMELAIVTNSLLTILKNNPKDTLTGLFSQIHQGTDNELVRERCIKFLAAKVKQLGREFINKEAEDFIIAESRKVLEDVVAEEFENIMELLTWSKLSKSPLGRKELVSLVAAQAFSPDDWHPKESECIERLQHCTAHALPFFSVQVNSNQFMNIFCDHVLKSWSDVTNTEPECDTKLELLKLFAELSEYSSREMEKAEDKINVVYDRLMEFLPEAPEENIESSDTPEVQFSHVECLLFALHALCRNTSSNLDADRLKSLRLRLQYTARLAHAYSRKLEEVTKGKKTSAETEENKIKLVALKTTSNIRTLIKDLFHTPPTYKSKVELSFRTAKKMASEDKQKKDFEETDSQSGKKHKLITFDDEKNGDKRRRSESDYKVYQPPSGKYSNRLSGGGRFRGNSRFRGGGSRFRSNGAPFRRRY